MSGRGSSGLPIEIPMSRMDCQDRAIRKISIEKSEYRCGVAKCAALRLGCFPQPKLKNYLSVPKAWKRVFSLLKSFPVTAQQKNQGTFPVEIPPVKIPFFDQIAYGS